MSLAPPALIEGPVPGLDKVHEVESIIRKATESGETPISVNEIKRRMRARAVRHQTVRTCIDHLVRLHLVAEAPGRGVEWAHVEPTFWNDDVVQLA